MPSLPWTSRTPPNAWPPASFPSWKLCEFIPISAASALNPASVNSSSAAPGGQGSAFCFLATRHSSLATGVHKRVRANRLIISTISHASQSG